MMKKILFGFTLIELLVALGILIAVAVIASINLASYRNKQSVESAALQIVAVLRDAQNRSISQDTGGVATGGFSQNQIAWGVYFSNTPQNAFYELFTGTPGRSIARVVLPDTVLFTSPSSGTAITIGFAPTTGRPISPSTISIALKNNPAVSKTITIANNGVIETH